MSDLTQYRRVLDPIAEGNPAPIVNREGAIMDCLECGYAVSSADGLCDDCWIFRHDARYDLTTGEYRQPPAPTTDAPT